jgi:hypothetical protein
MRAMIVIVVLAASGYWLLARPWQQGDTPRRPNATFLFSLEDDKVDESSGVADSNLRPGTYWTHNDSGGNARLFAFDRSGKSLGSATLSGVNARDWEDMASIKIQGVSYLYVGDIGDNLGNQAQIRVHRFPEISPNGKAITIDRFDTFTLSYPDGSHNAEALLVTPNGDIIIVTKVETGDAGVYRAKSPPRSGKYRLEKLGVVRLQAGNKYSHMITGGDVSPNGKQVALRTYFSIILFNVDKPELFIDARPQSLPVPLERQGEAVCFDHMGKRLITTSEGSPCRVSAVTLP